MSNEGLCVHDVYRDEYHNERMLRFCWKFPERGGIIQFMNMLTHHDAIWKISF